MLASEVCHLLVCGATPPPPPHHSGMSEAIRQLLQEQEYTHKSNVTQRALRAHVGGKQSLFLQVRRSSA